MPKDTGSWSGPVWTSQDRTTQTTSVRDCKTGAEVE